MNVPDPSACYLCGVPSENYTWDHVVPYGLFVSPRPSNLVTLPACGACHSNQLRQDEEVFRAFLLVQSRGQSTATKLWDDQVKRSINRVDYPGFRQMLASRLSRAPHPAPVFSDSGLYLGEARILDVPAERILPVISKIVKGLFWCHAQSLLVDVRFGVRHFDPSVLYPPDQDYRAELLPYAQDGMTFGDVLRYRYAIATDDSRFSVWWLSFYERPLFVVETAPSEALISPGPVANDVETRVRV